MFLYIISAFSIFILYIVWKFFFYKQNLSYWKKLGFPFQNGSFLAFMFDKKCFVDFDKELYKNFKGSKKNKVGILWDFSQPDLYILDCDLIKNVLVKDFEYFVNRRELKLSDGDMTANLFSMEGQDWKNMRSTLSPIFTTGKIKRMFQIFDSVGNEFVQFLKTTEEKEMDIRIYFGKYTSSVISKIVFGLNFNNFREGTTEFEDCVKLVANPSPLRIMLLLLFFSFSKVSKFIKFKLFPEKVQIYLKKLIKECIAAREKNPAQKWNDFLELILETRTVKLDGTATGEIIEEDTFEKDAQVKSPKTKVVLNDAQILSNCTLFMIAGFDTVETTLTWSAYELVKNPEIQEKIKREIEEHKEKHGELNYESIINMEYLDKFLQEVLRKYPGGLARLERRCEKEYRFKTDDLDFTIPKGTLVHIPVTSLHYDEEYWPNPDKFDPERFTRSEKEKRHPYSYLPFGHGPRNCIGMRFALIEVKVCLAHLIDEFELIPTKNTPIPVTFKKISMKPDKDILLALKPRH